MSTTILQLLTNNHDEKLSNLICNSKIKMTQSLNEAFYESLNNADSQCAKMLLTFGASFDEKKISDILCNLGPNDLHILENILECCPFIVDYCNNNDVQIISIYATKIKKSNYEYVKIICKFINAGFNMYKKGMSNILLVACIFNLCNLVKLLINKNFDINQPNINGETAIMIAIHYGYTECALILINAGANVNLQDKCGWTALMYAVKKDNREIISSLLNHQANVKIYNNELKSANDLADTYGNFVVSRKLKDFNNEITYMHVNNIEYLKLFTLLIIIMALYAILSKLF